MHLLKLPLLDGEKLLENLNTLAQFGIDAQGAMQRTAYTPADLEARDWVIARLHELGLVPRLDAAGNTTARYAGQNESLAPIGIGSHTDTVPSGGKYDGALGTLAALAVLEALTKANLHLQHPIEFINFAAEEATMAGGTTGSQAMVGIFDTAIFDKPAWDGVPVRAHFVEAGLNPADIGLAQRPLGSLAAFLELHIEQSDILLQEDKSIAIVEGFVGIRRYAVQFTGYANHAGTTPMHRRDDALLKAAPYVSTVNRIVIEHGMVGTVGKFDVLPGAPNVIPGQVEMVVEIRALTDELMDTVEEKLRYEAETLGASFTPIVKKPPVQADNRIMTALELGCQQLDLSYLKMPSAAGHDAMNMARICPAGMLFVPSQGGISHSPDEYTTPEDCINGANALLATMVHLDALLR